MSLSLHLAKILQKHCDPKKPLILAFSGGPDSICLLDLLQQTNYTVILAHLNHQLRGRASQENENFVQKISQKYQLPLELKRLNIKKKLKKGENLEAVSRRLRYQFLEKIKKKHQASFILTAHHLNDNIETIFLNIMRGCSLRGLKGMTVCQGDRLRPLLTIPQKNLIDYVTKKRLPYHQDLSNLDVRFKRNRLRHEVIPLLQKIDPHFEKHWLQAMTIWQASYHFAQKQSQQWLKKKASAGGFSVNQFNKLPDIMQMAILSELYRQHYGSTEQLTQGALAKMKDLINQKKPGKKAKFGHSAQLCISYDQAHVATKKENFLATLPLQPITIPGTTLINKQLTITTAFTKKIFPKKKAALFIDFKKLPPGQLKARSWQPGDKIQPLGMTGHKKIQDIFTDQKIPRSRRSQIPIFIDNKNVIVAIGQVLIDDKYKITDTTTKILKILVSFKNQV